MLRYSGGIPAYRGRGCVACCGGLSPPHVWYATAADLVLPHSLHLSSFDLWCYSASALLISLIAGALHMISCHLILRYLLLFASFDVRRLISHLAPSSDPHLSVAILAKASFELSLPHPPVPSKDGSVKTTEVGVAAIPLRGQPAGDVAA